MAAGAAAYVAIWLLRRSEGLVGARPAHGCRVLTCSINGICQSGLSKLRVLSAF